MTGPDLAAHLVENHLAGAVATPVGVCVENARKMLARDPDYTFGLSVSPKTTFDHVVEALRACGVTLSEDAAALPWVDPAVAVAAVERHHDGLAGVAARRGRVLLATGHAFALLSHYLAIARTLAAEGCTILQPLDNRRDLFTMPDGRPASIRYYGGVASVVVHGSIVHTHRPTFMEALLAEVGGPDGVDVVFADHGFAGAAVEAGVETYSIADVNDPALPLAQWQGRTHGVLVIDDGLSPTAYERVTAAIVNRG
jgi:hypothetical protein